MSESEYRGSTHLRREELETQRGFYALSDREGSSVRSDCLREDEQARQFRADSGRRKHVSDQLLKLGLAGLGALAFGRMLHKTGLGVEIMHGITSFGRRHIRKNIARSLASQATTKEAQAGMRLAIKGHEAGVPLSELGFFDKLEFAVGVAKRESRGGTDWLQTDLAKSVQHLVSPATRAPQGYSMLTIGEVLRDKGMRGLVGQQRMNLMQEGLGLGVISEKGAISSGLYMRGGMSGMAGIRDVSAFQLKNVMPMMIKGLGNVQIPFINFPISRFLTTPHKILKGAADEYATLRPRTYIPSTGQRLAGDGYVVGGKVFARDPRTNQFSVIAEGMKVGTRKAHGNLMQAVGAMERQFVDRAPRGGVFGWLEQKTGVGRGYAPSRSVISKYIFDPIRRIFRGELRTKTSVDVADFKTLPQNAADYISGVGSAEIPNLYRNVDDIPWLTRQLDKAKALVGRGKFVEYAAKHGQAIKGITKSQPGRGFAGQDLFLMDSRKRASTLANWLSMRPSEVMGWTAGVGYRPTLGKFGFVGNMAKLYGAWYAGRAGVEAGKYLDYQVEDVTGFSPIKAAAGVYTKLRVGLRRVSDTLGVTTAAQYMEDLMPGSISSSGSGFARTFVPPIAGAVLGGPRGLAIGAGIATLLGGIPGGMFYPEDVLKSSKYLKEEYAGERNVAVRSNRWWIFNPEEFSGGRISRFKPSWYQELLSDYQYTDVKYGSRKNYFRNVSMLPTPSNLFGLIPQADPGWLAEAQALRRPYPATPGSLLVSSKLSPVADEERENLGFGPTGITTKVGDPHSLRNRFSRISEGITEFLGIHKFLGESILGVQAPFKDEVAWASAAEMTSDHKAYWEAELGDLAGFGELLRRFILPKNALPRSKNNLSNLMMDFLPGYRSKWDEDTRYIHDFHRGDPYRSIPHGEHRLPGPGYMAVHRMHSGVASRYDAMDRYLILGDVAPYSRSFKEYQAIVESWDKAGVLDEYWKRKYQRMEEEVEIKKQPHRFAPRRFTGEHRQIKEINESIKYKGFEKTIGSAWEYVSHDIVGAVPFVGSKFLKARTPYKAYIEDQIYGSTYKDWSTPIKTFVTPHIQMGLAEGPLSSVERGGWAYLLGANPVSALVMGVAGAAGMGIASLYQAAKPGQYLPSDTKKRWEVQEYFDKLRYVRAKRLEASAIMSGNRREANRYQQEAERTITGLPSNATIGQIQAAMPTTIKPYFRGLVGTEERGREDIEAVLPPYVKGAFARMWGRGQSAQAPERQAAEYFGRNPLPPDEWLGWHPSIRPELSEIKFIEHGIGGISDGMHRFGLWENQVLENPALYAAMEAPRVSLSPRGGDTMINQHLLSELEGVGFMSVGMPNSVGWGGAVNMNVTVDRSLNLLQYADNMLRRA